MKDGGRPDGLGGEQVEGHHAVHELLAAGRRRTHRLWVVGAHSASGSVAPLAQLACDRGVQVLVKTADDLMQVARDRRTAGGHRLGRTRCRGPSGFPHRPKRSGASPFPPGVGWRHRSRELWVLAA